MKYIIEVVLFFGFFTFLIFFLHNKEVSGRLKLLFLDICLIAICIKYRYVVKQGEITSVTLSKILCKWQGLIKNGNTPVKKYSKLINC